MNEWNLGLKSTTFTTLQTTVELTHRSLQVQQNTSAHYTIDTCMLHLMKVSDNKSDNSTCTDFTRMQYRGFRLRLRWHKQSLKLEFYNSVFMKQFLSQLLSSFVPLTSARNTSSHTPIPKCRNTFSSNLNFDQHQNP